MNITKIQTPCGVSRCTFLDAERDIIYVVDGGEGGKGEEDINKLCLE